ncbi:hypothetical protein [Flavisolibacter tropicus]|uniref:Uncharacterized protein n=1 Tax=Flavisolibacter tropicus TaxID=1492898 RepID=A0A172TRF3_9BACT|nr:hypothetical protein [Flavisolibacter tropicus]ANE49576.1 hypothetical protein SY85_02720 [Flavisolibacter tropicus]
MQLYLAPTTKVGDVKEAFHLEFPFLKLEFFKSKHQPGKGTPLSDKATDYTLLVEVLGVMREGDIDIIPSQSVNEVEQLFQRKFNLPVQVFRKMGNLWIETTETDNLSLEHQNEMGREASLMAPQNEQFYDEG